MTSLVICFICLLLRIAPLAVLFFTISLIILSNKILSNQEISSYLSSRSYHLYMSQGILIVVLRSYITSNITYAILSMFFTFIFAELIFFISSNISRRIL